MPQGRDPYLRSWVKFPTYTIEQAKFERLTFDQFGVFSKALLWSTSKSLDIGYFRDRITGSPLSLEEIARAIRPDLGDAGQWVRAVELAFDALIAAELMQHNPSDGYFFNIKVYEQFLNENNLTAKRRADAKYQAASRARKKPSSNGRGRPPRMLRPVERQEAQR